MTDDELDQIVEKFTNADAALRLLATREQELRVAAAEFLKAGQAMERVQREGAVSLETARADFSEAAESSRTIAASTASILEGLGAEIERVSALTQQLRGLEPERLASDLDELRRDINDQAVELRELRRLESEGGRLMELMERRLSENSLVLDDIEAFIGDTRTSLAAISEHSVDLKSRLEQQATIATERAEQQEQRLNRLLTLTTLALLAAIGAILVQLL